MCYIFCMSTNATTHADGTRVELNAWHGHYTGTVLRTEFRTSGPMTVESCIVEWDPKRRGSKPKRTSSPAHCLKAL